MKAFSNPVNPGDIGMEPHMLTPDERRLLRATVHGIFEEIFWKLVVTNSLHHHIDCFEVFRKEIEWMYKKKVIVTTDYFIDSGPLQLCKEAARDMFIASIVRRAGMDSLEAVVMWTGAPVAVDV